MPSRRLRSTLLPATAPPPRRVRSWRHGRGRARTGCRPPHPGRHRSRHRCRCLAAGREWAGCLSRSRSYCDRSGAPASPTWPAGNASSTGATASVRGAWATIAAGAVAAAGPMAGSATGGGAGTVCGAGGTGVPSPGAPWQGCWQAWRRRGRGRGHGRIRRHRAGAVRFARVVRPACGQRQCGDRCGDRAGRSHRRRAGQDGTGMHGDFPSSHAARAAPCAHDDAPPSGRCPWPAHACVSGARRRLWDGADLRRVS